MIEDKFLSRIDKYNNEISKCRKEYDRIGYLRLIVMIGAIYFTYRIIKGEITGITIGLALLFYGLFMSLVIYHKAIKSKLQFAMDMIEINNRYLQRISGEWISFEDTGNEFCDKGHRYSQDLDIVGKESLFQLINITNTWKGRHALAKSLLEPNYEENEIIFRQEAVEELFNNLDLCEAMEYTGKSKGEKLNNPEKLLSYVEDDQVMIKAKIIKTLLYIMPMVTIPISLGIFIFNISNLKWLVTVFLIIQLGIWALSVLKVNRVLESVSYFREALEEYINILNLIEKQEFTSEKLISIQEGLFKGKESSLEVIKKLSKLAGKIDIKKNNGFLYFALNILLLWDYQCVFSLEAWKKKYGSKIEPWLCDIGEIEELMSLAVLKHVNETTCFPRVNSNELKIVAKDLGHPLISRDVRVTNDVDMKNNIFIITGSNMSGKTTFLRTIGINLVLAYIGAPVFSDDMECSLLKIYTSMRITDDLKNGISTFYGELIRIKDIIDGAKIDKKMIFLIDEIFRGTNSKDRITGADTVIRNLSKAGVVGALTTHDLELCSIAEDKGVKNYHFSEYYKDNKIYFDYKIREGKSTTTNAKYLMKIVGIDINEF